MSSPTDSLYSNRDKFVITDITHSDAIRPRIHALNVEKIDERFPARDAPSIATWRCNLVAASQRRNLVFTAHRHEIYVWIPNGPFQLLGSQPEMIICPVMKNPLADGFIDRTAPHNINNMLIDDLGLDEVLLLVTDSGNVCGYHVETIFSAISRCQKNLNMRPFDSAEVNPFFVESVIMSAWGLAVHKFARLIAVSSNTGLITVFAFALVESSSMEDGNEQQTQHNYSGQTWTYVETNEQLSDIRELMPSNYRSRNLRLTYRGHLTNIPSVAFANFGLDPCGTWMVSTDIRGIMLMWKVWEDLEPYSDVEIDPLVRTTPGWTVLPLDPRTFKRHRFTTYAHGFSGATCGSDDDNIPRVNLRRSLERHPDWFSGPSVSNSSVLPVSLPDDVFSPECCIDHELQPDNLEGFSRSPHSQVSQSANNDDIHSGLESGENSNEDETEDDCEMTAENQILCRIRYRWSLYDEDYGNLNLPAPHEHNDSKTKPLHPRILLGFPVLHFSATNITLIPYLDHPYRLTCGMALYQDHWPFRAFVNEHSDRFNMVKSIPELGIVVAATQKGRAAIISLTWHKDFGYSFRTDWITPFASQERKGERPLAPLQGIAVCPMQGFETPPDVPFIPQGVDPNDWLSFNYRTLDSEDSGCSSSSSLFPYQSQPPLSVPNPIEEATSQHTQRSPSPASHDRVMGTQPRARTDDSSPRRRYTVPELHAQATLNHRPTEHWHGSHPSRRYRLFLMYCDHTVMTYEFWHDWVR
ncbi:hypothetical protein N7495_007696 [Penicillium taxi]|uniref:uncharacterized protein n=1 Tax=Penicillium taxi TaxID=168475 RepID=UPI0025451EE0|nr:uncharacterized protein N7495_007696 [Penicillium taxi]KAJ5887655.1 hypothetical protein N7495_007696 [Penicillium taxi]